MILISPSEKDTDNAGLEKRLWGAAEINADAWATLNSDTSRAFEKPKQGRIAVKMINHLGDEVMKVFRVS